LIAAMPLTNLDYINAAVCFDSVWISERLAHGWSAIRVYQGDFKMRHALGVILLLVVGSVNAATIVYSSPGVVTGIGGLDIGGILYNVDFEAWGELDDYTTFGGEEDFWIELGEVLDAASAVNAVLSSPGIVGVNNPSLFTYQVNHSGGSALESIEIAPGFWGLGNLFSPVDSQKTTAWSVVPLPAAVWLFGSALAGLGWFRRRKTA
jgi:hypothetical protein